MSPIALQIGSLSIRWYGVMAALGLLAATVILNSNRKYINMTKEQCSNAIIVALIAGVLGARIFYVVQFFDLYRDNLVEIIRIDRGGLVYYGGFILAVVALFVYSRIEKIDFVRMWDGFAPALAVAHTFGRIGCFLNGCCYGKPTEFFTGIAYPAGSDPARRYGEAPLHPVQLYEAAENLLCAVLYFYLVRKAPRGVAVSSYFIIYGVLRFVNEFARGDHKLIWNLFTPAQLIGIVLITAGTIMLTVFLRRRELPSANS
ncbi:MAG: prolipoprotein diacylglyceryl transferase [Lentisphaeria bacterium]|nr:prolipoprotein diacylglyceryl transferase [Lentisphaeria bacterium]